MYRADLSKAGFALAANAPFWEQDLANVDQVLGVNLNGLMTITCESPPVTITDRLRCGLEIHHDETYASADGNDPEYLKYNGTSSTRKGILRSLVSYL